jgi:hypothetical protein
MAKKLDNLTPGIPETKKQNICERVALGCKGAEDEDTYRKICSVKRGSDCNYKPYQNIDSSGVGIF